MDSKELRSLMEAYQQVYVPQEVEQVDEADSLAAMQARREKRLAAQRKREGTTMAGNDTGHNYSLTPAQQKKRREDEYKAGTRKEEIEQVDEDSRRMSNKQHTARVRSNIKSFGSNYTPPSNYDPDANRGKGEVLTRKQIEKKRRKALRQEELEASGLFTEEEINAILESDEQFDEAMSSYDRNRKRAAQRAAARNAARAAGKTGVVPGVGYVSPRKERETYVDSAGTTRHKSGAKMP